MIGLGIVLVILGVIFSAGILYSIGAILLVVGVILWVLGSLAGRPVGGRPHYW